MENIENLSDEEIIGMLAELSALVEEDENVLQDEAKFPDGYLIDAFTAVLYLQKSGEVPNAEELYSVASKALQSEISRRLEIIPFAE
jgi:hypothetical protein